MPQQVRRLHSNSSDTAKMLLIALTISLAVAISPLKSALAAADTSPLGKLEDHFFQHNYSSDTEEDRLDRIEKLVFGESKSGDHAARLADLQKVVADADVSPATASGSSASSSTSASAGNSTSSSSGSGSNASYGSNSSTSDPALTATDYPRVDELEQLLLNQTFKTMPLSGRLTQLETKAFGKQSKSDDLSERTDRLEEYWEHTLSPSLEHEYISSVEWLENKVIGQVYNTKPLIERVQTLEGIVFPNQPPDTSSGIKEQLETLKNAVHLSKNSSPGVTPMGGQHSYPGQSAQNQYTQQGQYTSSSQYGQQQPQVPPPYPSNYQAPGYGQQSLAQQPYGQSYNQGFQMPSDENRLGNYQPPAQQYSQPQYNQAQNTQSQYGQAVQNNAGAAQTQEEPAQKAQGHPLLRGLAKALGAAATMASSAMSSGMMVNYGGGGMYGNSLYTGMPGGYGMGGYGMGSYGMGGFGSGIRF